MTVILQPIVNTDTFSVWKDRTNEIVEALQDVVSLGDAGTENANGNVIVNGNITTTNILKTDDMEPLTGVTGTITVNGKLMTGDLSVDSGTGALSQVEFTQNGVGTWVIETDTSHNSLDIGTSDGSHTLNINATTGIITSSGVTQLTLAADIIPNLDASKVTANTFSTARIPSLAATKITSGTFSVDRIPSLAPTKISVGSFNAGTYTFDDLVMTSAGVDTLTANNVTFNGAVAGNSIATKLQAETGTSNDTLMTPLRVNERIIDIGLKDGAYREIKSDDLDLTVEPTFLTTRGVIDATTVGIGYMLLKDAQSTGISAGSSISGVQTRVLNNQVSNTITGASLATNTITLPPGTYRINGSVPGYKVNSHHAYLYNVTDAEISIVGTSELSNSTSPSQTRSIIHGKLILASITQFQVRHATELAVTSLGLGAPAGGTAEVYTTIDIVKES